MPWSQIEKDVQGGRPDHPFWVGGINQFSRKFSVRPLLEIPRLSIVFKGSEIQGCQTFNIQIPAFGHCEVMDGSSIYFDESWHGFNGGLD